MIQRVKLSKKSYQRDFTTLLWCPKTKTFTNQLRCGPHRWSEKDLIFHRCKTQCSDLRITHPRGLMVNTSWRNRGLLTNNKWVSQPWKRLNSPIPTILMVIKGLSKLRTPHLCLNSISNLLGPNSHIIWIQVSRETSLHLTFNLHLSMLAIIASNSHLTEIKIHFTDLLH